MSRAESRHPMSEVVHTVALPDDQSHLLPSALTTNVHRVGDTPGSVPGVESR
ncbi:hypothetical protein FHX44_113691 [Pseudonocardia hierapolitana]|uniref:Uncharacterized protein n=1 Tax=Pseudonocardia hierapolitana TaxID=1128676 RepID=A0A561SSD1_9PSEU|nr:hypothetical protein FHX44_113691 [Pseudonocardia hierapolitana]